MSSRAQPADRAVLPPFEQVVEQHGRAVLRFCIAEAGVERGHDCFQETMVAALGAYAALRDAGAVRGWLLAIAARKVVDLHRASTRAPEPHDAIDELAATPGQDRDAALWARVARLPEKQRRALVLRYRGDLSHREIAEVMGTSEEAARRNVFEALAQLKKDAAREVGEASHEAAGRSVQPTWQSRSQKTTPRSHASKPR